MLTKVNEVWNRFCFNQDKILKEREEIKLLIIVEDNTIC